MLKRHQSRSRLLNVTKDCHFLPYNLPDILTNQPGFKSEISHHVYPCINKVTNTVAWSLGNSPQFDLQFALIHQSKSTFEKDQTDQILKNVKFWQKENGIEYLEGRKDLKLEQRFEWDTETKVGLKFENIDKKTLRSLLIWMNSKKKIQDNTEGGILFNAQRIIR